MPATDRADDVEKVIDWFRNQPLGGSIEADLTLLREFFERVAACDPSPLDREAAVSVAADRADWLTKKAAHRELSKARGVDRS